MLTKEAGKHKNTSQRPRDSGDKRTPRSGFRAFCAKFCSARTHYETTPIRKRFFYAAICANVRENNITIISLRVLTNSLTMLSPQFRVRSGNGLLPRNCFESLNSTCRGIFACSRREKEL